MVRENEIRETEVAVKMPPPTDACLLFVGRIHTPLDLAYGNTTTRPSGRAALSH